jgi:hypothetical protein
METNMKRSMVCLVFLIGILSVTALAGNKSRTGTAGAGELLIPVGARGVAMEGADLSFLSGVEAIYYNPAGLGRIEHGVEAQVSHMNYFADIGVDYGGIGVQAGDFGVLGFTIKSLSFGDIPVTTNQFPDGTGQVYSPTYLTMGLTYAKLLTDRISVGATANLVSEKIMSTSASGLAFNVGVQYSNLATPGLNLAVVVKNVGPQMQFDGSNLLYASTAAAGGQAGQLLSTPTAGFELPSSIEIGVGYQKKFDDKNSALLGGTFRNNNASDDEYSLAGEYNYDNTFFVRGGYIFAPQVDKDPTGAREYLYDFSVGAGVGYPVGGIDLRFDYGYRHMKFFGGNNVMTLRLGF